MVLGVFLGTLGPLNMSIWCRRNTNFHVFDPRKCDLEMSPRKSWKKVRFWKDCGLHFGDFCLPKRIQKSSQKNVCKKVGKRALLTDFLGWPGGKRSRRGETREGSESQKMQDLGKSFWKGILSSHNLSTLGF